MGSEQAGGAGLFGFRLPHDGLASLELCLPRCRLTRAIQLWVQWSTSPACPPTPSCARTGIYDLNIVHLSKLRNSMFMLVWNILQSRVTPLWINPPVQIHSIAFPRAWDLRICCVTIPYPSRSHKGDNTFSSATQVPL